MLRSIFSRQLFFGIGGGLTLLFVFIGWYFEKPYLLLAPLIILSIAFAFINTKAIYFLLLGFIPLSKEVKLSGGFGTDLPTEFIMVGLLFAFIFLLLSQKLSEVKLFIKHPISSIVWYQLLWLIITVIFSTYIVVSLKFVAAKIWYLASFFLLTFFWVKEHKDIKTLFWVLFVPTILSVLYVINNHAYYNFAFTEINKCVGPFYRNHVNYASYLALFFPFLWLARHYYVPKSIGRRIINAGICILLIGIYFSYTRAAWVSIVLLIPFYFIIQKKIISWALIASGILFIGGITYLLQGNRYLDYAPEYTKTIYHHKLDDHLDATYKFEDVSTAERFYRWVAGVQMVKDGWFNGFGPGTFYFNYKRYTVSHFTTYVSDNPEKSGVHNYYLMTLIDQGAIGLLLLIILIVYVLLLGQKIYHQQHDPMEKKLTMALLMSFFVICVLNFFSDLIETDKIGAFFFITLALLIRQHMKLQHVYE